MASGVRRGSPLQVGSFPGRCIHERVIAGRGRKFYSLEVSDRGPLFHDVDHNVEMTPTSKESLPSLFLASGKAMTTLRSATVAMRQLIPTPFPTGIDCERHEVTSRCDRADQHFNDLEGRHVGP